MIDERLWSKRCFMSVFATLRKPSPGSINHVAEGRFQKANLVPKRPSVASEERPGWSHAAMPEATMPMSTAQWLTHLFEELSA